MRKDANTTEALDRVIQEDQIQIAPKTYDCLTTVMDQFENTAYYVPACFENSYQARRVLDYNLKDKAVADKEAIDEEIAGGTAREEAIAPYITEEAFDSWYEVFVSELSEAAGLNG